EFDETPTRSIILATLESIPGMPTPIGIFREVSKPTYDGGVEKQIEDVTAKLGKGDLQKTLYSANTWEVK
ncbi:MAG: 2-oxoacid:ferredoxin oxidoreductase subunit beta, partial [Ignavibacteriaceae bacterium]|nr:2-oxoacid:ferredoxin oxidoreductase subunit beta [Ignavibacteriaceae bacterium]